MINFFEKAILYKYELLLLALIQHLFIGIFLTDMDFYTHYIWPINMVLLGLGSVFVFSGKQAWKHKVRNILFIVVTLLPVGLLFFGKIPWYFQLLNIIYVLYFCFIFIEVIQFLIRPGYINTDIISASICGYLLLIEICVFGFQIAEYSNPESFKGITSDSAAHIFIDLVYFCSITFTSIGFGDITPNTHVTKLITAFIGVAGQFYTIVLVGILISKFSSKQS